jgi:bifunctional ADP-heptose synthase (sugar kinase/adenylyltransferase)
MLQDTQQQNQYKILLIGESCSDEYVFGTCNRISPEAPVPILKEMQRESREGMSGNVYNNIISMFGKNKVEIKRLNNPIQDIRKIRFIDKKSSYHVLRHDIEKKLDELTLKNIPFNTRFDAVIISDYNKGFLSSKIISKITEQIDCDMIFVDTKKNNLSSFKNSIIKLNEEEWRSSHNLPDSSSIITTLGERGARWNGSIYPSKRVHDVYDVCGAGDVFLSALVVTWLETRNIIQSIRVANLCASHSVTKLGTVSIPRDKYLNFVSAVK